MSGHRYESVGDGNIGVESEVISPAYDSGSGNDSVGYETTIPIHPRILAPLCYILPLAPALIILLLEHRNTYVRLHAWQSIILGLAAGTASMLLFWIPFIPSLVQIAGLFAGFFCAFHAWKDSDTLTFFKLGVIGDFAERQVLGATVLPF
ncbi:hypothetical protein BX661DRAFT_180372 [Kickxella alabastrina]|uniref:Uncharacterized protein n=2 Tax=Kickxella alabastrina TaxID=61397 RepID=A0ACC1IT97_9FUNG|nr:uncharacterized protein BX661DRAFT_180372 [Kickxella alabastrina]KAI7830957.1 hypothetical protein BX661DRAFT_180372 [Kickxella alabastrina]KAJ1900349.1 hypothetical protein LPJ66_001525 [Kickxella alabastrina]KAJ1900481.1 hypothetical protein LPJ66_001436 [Kickxella alabastrina]KAJ1931897.1 hypothetical protein GGF37_007239 [Kickxella alabastrina]